MLNLCVQGLAVTPDDAWSVHSVAHVYEMRADVDKGLKFMAEREKDWAVSADAPPASGNRKRFGKGEAKCRKLNGPTFYFYHFHSESRCSHFLHFSDAF